MSSSIAELLELPDAPPRQAEHFGHASMSPRLAPFINGSQRVADECRVRLSLCPLVHGIRQASRLCEHIVYLHKAPSHRSQRPRAWHPTGEVGMQKKPIVADGPMTINARMRRLGYPATATYTDYLASAHWQAVRKRYSASALPQDCGCGAPRAALHHKTYVRLGAELLKDLQPVCDPCHRRLHGLDEQGASVAKNQKKAKRKHRSSRRPNGTVLDVACPICKAERGRPCNNGHKAVKVHPARRHKHADTLLLGITAPVSNVSRPLSLNGYELTVRVEQARIATQRANLAKQRKASQQHKPRRSPYVRNISTIPLKVVRADGTVMTDEDREVLMIAGLPKRQRPRTRKPKSKIP